MSVCSWLRNDPVAAPYALTSLRSAAHCTLVRSGGPGARNCDGLSIPNGLVLANHGVAGVAGGGAAPGVIWYTPGPLPNTYGTAASRPSSTLVARNRSATSVPTAIPRVCAG